MARSEFVTYFLHSFSFYRYLGFFPVFMKSANETVLIWPSYHLVVGLLITLLISGAFVCHASYFVNSDHIDILEYCVIYGISVNYTLYFVLAFGIYLKTPAIFRMMKDWVCVERDVRRHPRKYTHKVAFVAAYLLMGLATFLAASIWIILSFDRTIYSVSDFMALSLVKTNLPTKVFITVGFFLTNVSQLVFRYSTLYLVYSLKLVVEDFTASMNSIFDSNQILTLNAVNHKRHLHRRLCQLIHKVSRHFGIFVALNLINRLFTIFTMAYAFTQHPLPAFFIYFIVHFLITFADLIFICENGHQIQSQVSKIDFSTTDT